jgi:hypothetical protein
MTSFFHPHSIEFGRRIEELSPIALSLLPAKPFQVGMIVSVAEEDPLSLVSLTMT